MDFQQALNLHFPQALSEEAFIQRSYDALLRHGFNGQNSIACVSVCRDEITRSLVDSIQAVWGEAFNFSSLGGMVFLGKTGFTAAHHHAPADQGRERYVYFAMAHIAIGKRGQVGICNRAGRSGPSGACGALIAFREEILKGRLNIELDMEDIEQSLLKQRLLTKIPYGEIPDLVKLTQITYRVIVEDFQHMVKLTVNPAANDYAILSGIQIHGPECAQYVWPGEMYVMKAGERSLLVL